MTALTLFDAVAADRADPRNPAQSSASDRLTQFAQKLVAGTLADLDRIREYEQQFGLVREGESPRIEILRSIWELYAQWAGEAEQVLARVAARGAAGATIAGTTLLDDALGRVQARLTVSPDETADSIDSAEQGHVISMREMRDELHARLRS